MAEGTMAHNLITTERLVMRRAEVRDLGPLHDVLSHAEAMRYWSTPPHNSLHQTREWLKHMMASPESASDDFVLEYQGRVIGKAGFWRYPEIGYILHPDFWGRGLAFEGLSALVDRVFRRTDLDAVVADVDPRNAASLHLLDKLGFVETRRATGTSLVGDEWCDSIYLELRRGLDRAQT